MAAISAVFTISHVAALLGEDEEWLQQIIADERQAGKAPPKPGDTR